MPCAAGKEHARFLPLLKINQFRGEVSRISQEGGSGQHLALLCAALCLRPAPFPFKAETQLKSCLSTGCCCQCPGHGLRHLRTSRDESLHGPFSLQPSRLHNCFAPVPSQAPHWMLEMRGGRDEHVGSCLRSSPHSSGTTRWNDTIFLCPNWPWLSCPWVEC